MSQARALSAEEIRGLRDELAGGGTPTVWFTAAAVGVPEGRSGKVTALDDPAEGDFIQVRPAGSKDVLSFSAGEVTVVKPPRKRKEPEPAAGKGPTGTAAGSGPAKSAGSAKSAGPAAGKTPSAASTPSSAAGASAAAGSRSTGPAKAADAGEAKKTPGSGTARRKPPKSPAGATVVLTADDGGQWNVEVSNGKKRVLRPMPVTASAVAQAARSLHEDVAAAVEPLLDAAREQQRDRVERLQQELADAQRMLDELT